MEKIYDMRAKESLDFDWKFCRGECEGAEHPSFNDVAWQVVDLPHDYTIEGPFNKEYFYGAAYLPKEKGFYRKDLFIPADAEGQRVYLEFEGIFRQSSIWVNGKYICAHREGYTGFYCDITDAVSFGEENLVAVKIDNADNPEKDDWAGEGWWYEGNGIYRHVYLHIAPGLRVENDGVFVITPEVSEQFARISVRTAIAGNLECKEDCILESVVVGPDGETLFMMKTETTVPCRDRIDIEQDGGIYSPALWSPDAPNLYRLQSRLIVDGWVTDSCETTFGIRSLEFTPDAGFFLNGKPLQLRGMCIHHDFGGLGTALPDRAVEKTLEVMKEMGCNYCRISHNDPGPVLADACDRYGILLWAEHRYLFDDIDVQLPALRSLIKRNRNHPSVFCWGLANTAGDEEGHLTEKLKVLHKVAKEEDPTRPTAFGCEGNTDANRNGFAFVTDIVGYNGGGMGIDDRDHELFPERVMLVSEFSSGRGARGKYRVSDRDGDCVIAGDGRMFIMHGDYLSEYQLCLKHEAEWTHIAERSWLAGGSMWSGIEYYGETNGWPTVTSQFGVLDICRFPKDAYYYYQQEWTKKPMVHIFPHWTWHGLEGEPIDVWCYSNCEEVELFLNGESLGRRRKEAHTHVSWDVPYTPGILSVRGYISERVAAIATVETAGPAHTLMACADRVVIGADRQDVSFVTISVLDDKGIPVPDAEAMVRFNVTGAGRLAGISSGDPKGHQNVKGREMQTFGGLVLAVVQSNGDSGEIELTASSNGLCPASIAIRAEAREIVKV